MDLFNKTAVSIFLFGCKLFNQVTAIYTYLYITNKYVRDVEWYIKTSYRIITFQNIEPYNCPWISKSWLTPNMTAITCRHTLNEEYKTNFDEVFVYPFKTVYDSMNTQYKTFCDDTITNNSALFIMKLFTEYNDTCYIVSIHDAQIPSTIQKSPAKFLSIEYKHPEMKNSIELTLDRSWFYTGNVLFTPTFVLRALKYQSELFFFDMDYTICIMDKDINIVELDYNKYILLTETGYQTVEEEVVEYDLVDDEDEDEDEDEEEKDSQMLWREQFELCGQFLNDIS
jgi:hypothetical protein